MKNTLLPLFIIALSIAACNPKDNTPPEPEEYFNCEINGKYWTYRADMSGFNPCPGIGAGPSGSLGYILAGRDCKGFPKTELVFYITGGNSFPDKDTFELGGASTLLMLITLTLLSILITELMILSVGNLSLLIAALLKLKVFFTSKLSIPIKIKQLTLLMVNSPSNYKSL